MKVVVTRLSGLHYQVKITGEFDLVRVAMIEPTIRQALDEAKVIGLNLDGVTIFDSAMFSLLSRMRKSATEENKRLYLVVETNKKLIRTIHIMSFDKLFEILTVDEAAKLTIT